MMTQTWALLLDAYRELNAKKLFWITLVIAGAVVGAFAAVGINERGITLLWWEFEGQINTRVLPAHLLYKGLFASLAIPIWLGWIASILGLVSTAGIIPDFIAGGAIELSLSKPIGRTRLLMTKFASALMFMFLQVSVFSLACFLVIGLRGKTWEPRLFLAIPIMVMFFSYLYCVCLLLGLITRSTIASLLLTLLFWVGVFSVNTCEGIFLTLRESNSVRVEALEKRVARLQERENARAPEAQGETPPARSAPVEQAERELAEARSNGVTIRRGHAISMGVKAVCPKTSETSDLLQRALLSRGEREMFRQLFEPNRRDASDEDEDPFDRPGVGGRVEEALLGRSLLWVIGTSLAFEAVVLGIGAWLFARRDF
jgi:hypothetical protein